MGNKILFLFVIFFLSATPAFATTYYVSPSGNDSNQGTQSQPFQTIGKAQDTVRTKIQQGFVEPMMVYLRAGTYAITTPLTFTIADSGTAQYGITYQSYPGEQAVISGGKQLTGTWTQESGSVWKLPIPAGILFRSLFKNDIRQTRARFPNNGTFMRITGINANRTQITFDLNIPDSANWDINTEAELITLYNWETSRTPVSLKNISNGVTTSGSVGDPDVGGGLLVGRIGLPVFIEGAKTLINQSGEWYLDNSTHTLYFQGDTGENPNTSVFMVPIPTELLTITGTASTPVINLTFKNLIFEYSDWVIPALGYDGVQATYNLVSKTPVNQPLPSAIKIIYSQTIQIINSIVRHIGMGGIAIGAKTKSITLDHNEVSDIGGNCIHLGWDLNRGLGVDWTDSSNTPDTLTISNNTVTGCGVVFFGANGIFSSMIKNSAITHNLITNLPYTGIGVTGFWNKTQSTMSNVAINYNKIHDVMGLLADGGGIYTTGSNPGGQIQNNLIYNVSRSSVANGASNNGIFLDQGSSGYTIANNIIYNTTGEAIRYDLNTSSDHTFGTNWINILPDSANYPASYAEQTGPQYTVVEQVGDVNGDGKADVVGFGNTAVWVALSTGTGFGPMSTWSTNFGASESWTTDHPRMVGDVNGDGKADLVGFGNAAVLVALSTGNGFAPMSTWSTEFDASESWTTDHPRMVGDVNGDGKADLVGFGIEGVYVALSTGTGFSAMNKWSTDFGNSANNGSWTINNPRPVGDVNGDGKDDVVGFGNEGVYVALSTGTGFSAMNKWSSDFGNSANNGTWTINNLRMVGDVNGDGKDDVVGFGNTAVYVALSTGSGFGSMSSWSTSHPRLVGDVNGDGKDDLVGFSTSDIWVATSTGSGFLEGWAITSPSPTPAGKPGDANGDGKVDGVDYVIWLNHYGQTITGGYTIGDFNTSGKVDGVDYVVWLNNYGT